VDETMFRAVDEGIEACREIKKEQIRKFMRESERRLNIPL
jgi:hypothetical protein